MPTTALALDCFDSPFAPCRAAPAPPPCRSVRASSWTLREHAGSDRAAVEDFIARRFAASFAARVGAFMPQLFSLRDRHGAIAGAFGLRSARQPLFVEGYLDDSVERVIGRSARQAVERASIVEIGHFCGAFPGAMRTMITLLAPRLYCTGYAWVVFTGTQSLHNAFARVGMHPLAIAIATADRLTPQERAAWGTYYDHAPRVFAGRIEDGVRVLASDAARAKAVP